MKVNSADGASFRQKSAKCVNTEDENKTKKKVPDEAVVVS
jgi:hypothetical protein